MLLHPLHQFRFQAVCKFLSGSGADDAVYLLTITGVNPTGVFVIEVCQAGVCLRSVHPGVTACAPEPSVQFVPGHKAVRRHWHPFRYARKCAGIAVGVEQQSPFPVPPLTGLDVGQSRIFFRGWNLPV